jgi:proline dehydrogenase
VFRELLIAASASPRLRGTVERSTLGLRLARRFVAGTTLEQAIAATQALNEAGIAATIDQLGENVTSSAEAQASAESYHILLEAIQTSGLNANVSVKLTHLGLDVDGSLCTELACSLVEHAARNRNFVRIDMEGSAYTQRTLDLVRTLHRCSAGGDAVGAVVQSYLRRSQADISLLCAEGIRVRLVKGAYKEPPQIAFPRKPDVDSNFMAIAETLLNSGLYHAIATHDERIIRKVAGYAGRQKIPREAFEFQMLYGVRRQLQQQLVREGWRVRVYIPFGTQWYPYLMRRLAERPANLWFLIKHLFRA